MEPGKVTEKNAHQIRERLYGHDEPVKPCNLQVGDRVRIPRIKNIHSKGYAQSEFLLRQYFKLTLFFQIGLIRSTQF